MMAHFQDCLTCFCKGFHPSAESSLTLARLTGLELTLNIPHTLRKTSGASHLSSSLLLAWFDVLCTFAKRSC